jgi:hypothetical protein
METKDVKKTIPSPEQRPDLYDDFDGIERPEGQPTGVKTPDYIQKLIAERGQRKPPAADQNK